MSYNQDNPFSRKSSPLNKDDKWIQKATASIKERGTEGVCTGDKFGGPTCPPGSKRYTLAKTFKAMAKKGGPSRESSEEKYMPIEDDMHKRGEGDMGMSRQPYGGNKGDEKRSVRDYEGPSRKSSSPVNHIAPNKNKHPHPHPPKKKARKGSVQWYLDQQNQKDKEERQKAKGVSRESSSPVKHVKVRRNAKGNIKPDKHKHPKNDPTAGTSFDGKVGPYNPKKDLEERGHERWNDRLNERSGGPSRRSSSPLNNTGITGLNYSKELQYMPIEDDMNRGMSRESSSPLDYGSWANEDATRAKELYKKGDYAHARALGVDEHDADYGKWKSSEAEHGPSRKSRSERLRSRAMKRSERSGAEWGDYDYEDKRVQKMLSKASELDERSGGRLEGRAKRIDDRFIKKGGQTDMDIELHERRINKLAKKGG